MSTIINMKPFAQQLQKHDELIPFMQLAHRCATGLGSPKDGLPKYVEDMNTYTVNIGKDVMSSYAANKFIQETATTLEEEIKHAV